MKKPYSYHTFMYPFSYYFHGDKLPLSDLWEEEFLPETLEQDSGVKEQEILLYNEYQYFFPKARTNLFNFSSGNTDKSISRHYCLKGLDGKDSFYVIRLNAEEYRLPLRRIRLSLYPEFLIGILSFEMEYYPKEGRDSFEDALEINQLGRRLFPPYMKAENGGSLKGGSTADEINITGAMEYKIKFHKAQYQLEQRMEFIKSILLGAGNWENIEIQSILDDRMFVCCLIRDNKVANTSFLQALDEKIETEQAKNVYRFVFVDGKGEYSCQSQRMLEKELQTHIYDRWINYGTFHGVTEYSFVCATGEGDSVQASVVTPFLTSYVDMAKIALAQRAAIINIENKILNEVVSKGSTEEVDKQRLENIREIWRIYVDFQNKLFLPEVTFQKQGVELYQILKESLKITVMNSHLGEELDHLHNAAELENQLLERKSDEEINGIINFVTIAGLTTALISMSQDFFFGIRSMEKNVADYILSAILWGVPFISMLCGMFLFEHKKGGRKGNKKKNRSYIFFLAVALVIYITILLHIIRN